MDVRCESLAEVRAQIDRLDRQIVALLAERGRFVSQAARFKGSSTEVPAPDRVAQVLAKVGALAEQEGANPQVVAQVYLAMIGAFIEAELAEHARLQRG